MRQVVYQINGKEAPKNDNESFLEKSKIATERLQKYINDFYSELEEKYNLSHRAIRRELSILKVRATDKIIKEAKEKEKLSLFSDEPEIKSWFKEYFREDFYIESEVPGLHISENQNVKIDYILYPRQHLIDNGFIDECFGVEVKYIDPESSSLAKKANKAIWQTISYNDCKFNLKNGKQIKPKFCMVFSNLSFDEVDNLYKEFVHTNNYRTWFYYLLLSNHANVGELRVKGLRVEPTGWTFKFGNSGAYFNRSINNTNQVSYTLQNENLVHKKRIGNFQ